jgi:hypothetical protein
MKSTLIIQYHPAAALHQPRLWADMLDDWQNMPGKVDADYIVVTWEYTRSELTCISIPKTTT